MRNSMRKAVRVRRWVVVMGSIAFGIALASSVRAQMIASLRTQQMSVSLAADEHSPRLLWLRAVNKRAWVNAVSEPLIVSAEFDGKMIPLHWELDRPASRVTSHSVEFVYTCADPKLRLTWEWQARADFGPIEHSIRIENLDVREIWLPLQDSFDFHFRVAPDEKLRTMYIDKGMGKPSDIGTHEVPITARYQWEGRSSSYARDVAEKGDGREIIPWFMVERANLANGWYAGIEFSGRTRLSLQRAHGILQGAIGLNPDPGPFRTRLPAGGTFSSPTVLLGAFTRGADGLGNILRPWVRQVLNNPETWDDPQYPLLVNNSWGSGMQVEDALARRMIRDSAELGLEMFHLDAGWFRGVGDWYPDPAKFPRGLAPIADEAHRQGLRFGLWVDWAQAGVDSEAGSLNVRDAKVHDWLVADAPADWKPDEFVGRTMDLGNPATADDTRQEVNRIVTEYHLDMLEHDGYLVAKNCARNDHPHAPRSTAPMSVVTGNGIAMLDDANSTDVSYHAVHAYYDIYAGIRRRHPGLLFEICNDGGRMVDFGSASHGDYFSITDSYDPLSNRQAFYDASHLLPPAMLESYVQKWPTPKVENFRYELRSGMMGWLTIMQDTNAWTPAEHAAAKEQFALYKKYLRPLIRDAALYHVSKRADGVHWDGIEYYDARRGEGVLYAFRGSGPEGRHAFLLQGLRADRRYRLQFRDHSSSDRAVSGRNLMERGLAVSLGMPQSSELIFLSEVRH